MQMPPPQLTETGKYNMMPKRRRWKCKKKCTRSVGFFVAAPVSCEYRPLSADGNRKEQHDAKAPLMERFKNVTHLLIAITASASCEYYLSADGKPERTI